MALGNPPIALPLGARRRWHHRDQLGEPASAPPPAVATSSHKGHGFALADLELLGPRVAEVEATIGVAPAPMGVLGRNGELALEGAAALDWRAPAAPQRAGLPRRCQCAIGCPNNAKGGVHLNALPQACEAGRANRTGLRVQRVLSEDGRATGVLGAAGRGGEVRIAPPDGVSSPPARSPPRRCCAAAASAVTPGSGAISDPPRHRNHRQFRAAGYPWRGVMQSVGIEELHE